MIKSFYLYFCVLTLCFLSLCKVAHAQGSRQAKLSDLLIEKNVDYNLSYAATKQLKDSLIANFFYYRHKEAKWPYGTGIEISHPSRSTPVWFTTINGDFPPHTLRLIDLNLDGNLDIFYHVGFEDVYSTYVYTANFDHILSAEYSEENFQPAYRNENDYTVLINLEDNSIQPLILDSGYEGTDKRSGTACFEYHSYVAITQDEQLTINDSLKQEIISKYLKMVEPFDKSVIEVNNQEVYALSNTFILDPIKILKITHNTYADVTANYPDYIRWRIRLLEEIRKESSQNCEQYIDRTIVHLSNYLNGN